MSAGLAIEALVAGYRRDLPIVRDVTLSVAPGEVVCLLGPNGAGKSTLVKAVAGHAGLFGGSVRVAGREIGGLPAHRIAGAGIGYVPQLTNVFTTLTVLDNLRAGALGLPGAAGRIAAAFARFPDLDPKRRAFGGDLSGGQRQMLAIARTLVRQPAVLLLDEPSAGLSPKIAADLFAQVRRIADEGVAILMVEQNVKAGLAVADRAIVLAVGRTALSGTAAAIRSDPTLGAIFLGGHAERAA